MQAREVAEPPTTTTTIEGIPGVEYPPECHQDRAVAGVCGRFSTIAGQVIRPVSGRQLSPARVTILPDGRLRYEEHLFDEDAFSLESEIEAYEEDLVATLWTPLSDNAPPHLRYQLVEHGITYVLTMDLRSAPGAKEGDVQLFVDAVVETREPVRS